MVRFEVYDVDKYEKKNTGYIINENLSKHDCLGVYDRVLDQDVTYKVCHIPVCNILTARDVTYF